MSTRSPDDGGVGDTFRMLEEAGRLGASLAGRVAEDFRRLAFDAAPNAHGHHRSDGASGDELRANLRAARLDLERATDDVMNLLGSAADTYAGWADQVAEVLAERGEPGVSTLHVDAAQGSCSTAELWVHNTTSRTSGEVVLHVAPLVSPSGAASTIRPHVTCSDAHVDPGSSAQVAVAFEVGPDVEPGVHHGLVLLSGVPDAVVHLRVDVTRVEGS